MNNKIVIAPSFNIEELNIVMLLYSILVFIWLIMAIVHANIDYSVNANSTKNKIYKLMFKYSQAAIIICGLSITLLILYYIFN